MGSPAHQLVCALATTAAFLVLHFGAKAARAHQNIHVTMTNAAVIPPNIPADLSSGTATLVVDDHNYAAIDFDMAVFDIDVTGLQTPADPNDDLLGAAVHASPSVQLATNGPLVWGLSGTPNNNTAPADLQITPFAGVGGAVYARWDLNEGNNTTLAAQLGNVLSGHAYILFRTLRHTGGELRGNIPAWLGGDADLNGAVDVADLGILASNWQTAGTWIRGDFDNSGFIDVADLGILASNWQAGDSHAPTGPPPSFSDALASVGLGAVTVPEPGGAILILALLPALRRRRVTAIYERDLV
jgi:hypothetical protein